MTAHHTNRVIRRASKGASARSLEAYGFDAIRKQVPEGSSAVVVFAGAERVRAMYRARFAAADTFVRLSPADGGGAASRRGRYQEGRPAPCVVPGDAPA